MAEARKGGFEVFLDRLSSKAGADRQQSKAAQPDPAERIVAYLGTKGASPIAEVLRASTVPVGEAIEALEQLEKYGLIEYESGDRKVVRLSEEGTRFAATMQP